MNGAGAHGTPAQGQPREQLERLLEEFAKSKRAGNDEAAMHHAMEAFVRVAEEATRHPTPDLRWRLEAEERTRLGDWAGAEQGHREVLKLTVAEGNQGIVAKAHGDLCRFLQLVGRLDEAWEEALASTAAARRFDMSMQSPHPTRTRRHQAHPMATRAEGRLLWSHDVQDALQSAAVSDR